MRRLLPGVLLILATAACIPLPGQAGGVSTPGVSVSPEVSASPSCATRCRPRGWRTPPTARPTIGATAAGACSTAYLPLPDPRCTPGATNPQVAQTTIDSTICVRGWTATVRPVVSYTEPLKIRQITEYGYPDTRLSDYEEDHLIPLELGGAPDDPRNLWPEPRYDTRGYNSYDKDHVENELRKLVCDGRVRLGDAQHAIVTDWTTALQRVGD